MWLGPSLDAHAHPLLFEDPDAYMHRRRLQGIRCILSASVKASDWLANLALAHRHPEIRPCLGLHPAEIAKYSSENAWREDLDIMEDIIERQKASIPIAALSECGLDARYPRQDWQSAALDAQIDIANRHDLPIILHCVKAFHLLPKRLKRCQTPIIHHGFSASLDIQRWALAEGHYVSLGRALMRKKPPQFEREIFERAFLESDDDATREPLDLRLLLKFWPQKAQTD